jgi:hypothetical protein
MKLNKKQKELFAEKIIDLAHIAIGSLIFSQLLYDKTIYMGVCYIRIIYSCDTLYNELFTNSEKINTMTTAEALLIGIVVFGIFGIYVAVQNNRYEEKHNKRN